MKPRQIKKNSKSAMELLIKVFNIPNTHIYLDHYEYANGDKGSCYIYSHAKLECMDFLSRLGAKGKGSKPDYMFKKMRPVQIIQYCRKLAKAGVRFR